MPAITPEKRKRGLATSKDIADVKTLSSLQKIALLDSPNAWERTAAVFTLGETSALINTALVTQLVEMLQNETALYTRLAIGEVLQKGDLHTASLLCSYLGRIGSNQLTAPEPPSKKKSYPLPRDLAARILGKMQPDILPATIEVLQGSDMRKISEAIDAYGFLLFYQPSFATKARFLIVQQLLDTYPSNELLAFKCATCLSAFHLKESEALLKTLHHHTNIYIAQNAERSLLLLHNIKR